MGHIKKNILKIHCSEYPSSFAKGDWAAFYFTLV